MRELICLAFLIATLAGCGHSATHYTPAARAGMTWERAVSIVEQGFYEDYGKGRAESVQVNAEAIILSDGSITTATHAGTVVPIYGAAAVVGSSSAKTVAAGQRIYLRSLQPAMVLKRNGREHRYAVVIRINPGATARNVYFRAESRAEEFADALEYLRTARVSAATANVPAVPAPADVMGKEQYKQMQIQRLMEQNLPYEEYSRRMREIQAQ